MRAWRSPHLVGVVISEEAVCPPPVGLLGLLDTFLRLAVGALYMELSLSLKAELRVLIRAGTLLIIQGFRLWVLVIITFATQHLIQKRTE